MGLVTIEKNFHRKDAMDAEKLFLFGGERPPTKKPGLVSEHAFLAMPQPFIPQGLSAGGKDKSCNAIPHFAD
jgi:hypothetical protein